MNQKKQIKITGARANNLKNISVDIPCDNFVVVTGVSGSGKSSLTIDTLYAEGQRRYVESLSSYARQFLMRMKKPDVDLISGLCPAIAIEQRVGSKNARSTVGTLTEIYDYLRILFARIGKTKSPSSGQFVKKHQVSDVVDFIHSFDDGTRFMIATPISIDDSSTLKSSLDLLLQKGYSRLIINNETHRIDDLLESDDLDQKANERLRLVIDRISVQKDDKENTDRLADSINIAFTESGGDCEVIDGQMQSTHFNNRFEMDGIEFEEPSPQLFNFNSSLGACKKCEGYGKVLGLDEDKVVPDKNKSIYEGAVACWRGDKMGQWKNRLVEQAHHFDFPIHRSYKELTTEQKDILWQGNEYFDGIHAFFEDLEAKSYKIQNRVMLSRYRGKTVCPSCKGSRLRKEALYIEVDTKKISDLVSMPIKDLYAYFNSIRLNDVDYAISSRLITEIQTRLKFMLDVGLNYLTMNRVSSTLSGGEIQRIHLTRTLGSNLTSSLYVLDEPSIGLHPRDTSKLVSVLKELRDLGNTVVVVEHEEDIIANSDYLIDVGPAAGVHGGEIVFAGEYERIHDEATDCLTAKYMSGRMEIDLPEQRRDFTKSIWIKGANQHNLKSIDVEIPLNVLSVVSGVSGSGKTTLIKKILYPMILRKIGEPIKEKPGAHDSFEGDWRSIHSVEMIDQQPIGKSSRSNPVTYVKAYDPIRKLFSKLQASKIKGFKPKHFSFNVEGGRCENCKGDGEVIVSMQFLADVRLTCDECNGFRFKNDVLDVRYNEKNIYEILDLSVDQAVEFFSDHEDIISKLKPLQDVGLGYIALGQPSSTLSGGEAQRVKLASFLGEKNSKDKILFIFDEPTTGLHFHDVNKLLKAFNELIEIGHTVIVIEHNMDVIKCADYLIDLGPEGGELGGHLIYQGKPEGILEVETSYTGQFLKDKL